MQKISDSTRTTQRGQKSLFYPEFFKTILADINSKILQPVEVRDSVGEVNSESQQVG